MSRGNLPAAIETFREAITLDPAAFRPKNNLVIARNLSDIYTLLVVPMSGEEWV